MNQKDINNSIKLIRKYRKKVTSSKKAALESLIKAGICDKDGKLSSEYR